MTYRIDVSPEAQHEIKRMPGHVRQRVRRAIKSLADDPRPAHTRPLNYTLADAEPRPLRLEHWRVVYAVLDDVQVIAIVGVRRRPPYDYGDLPELFEGLG